MIQRIQVKICGLTDVASAVGCVGLGADAVGLVFYPKSPRYLTEPRARAISDAVASRAAVVGVFVDAPFATVMRTVERCALSAVQLHGKETPVLAQRLHRENLTVIKALFQTRAPDFTAAGRYPTAALLLECGRGRMPGGNAEAWNWAAAGRFWRARPSKQGGGRFPENVVRAVALGRPDAVDVSSGVESAPGRKDLKKVAAFLAGVAEARQAVSYPTHNVF
jgi:phosphoribosylanthranilate isomerase